MIKKNLSSVAIRKVVEEARVLEGSFFQKAYQLDYGTMVLRFNVRREQLAERSEDNALARLLMESSEGPEEGIEKGISLDEAESNYVRFDLYFKIGGFAFFSSKISSEMPRSPSNFAMKLRKSLRNRVLKGISQVGMDRVIVLRFNPFGEGDEDILLYMELFGDGNAILVRGDVIEAPFTSRSWASRTVKRGEVFLPPPSGIDPFELDREEFDVRFSGSGDDLVRFLIRRIDLPPIYAEEVCFRAGLDKKSPVSGMSQGERDLVWKELNELLVEVEGTHGAYVHMKNGEASLIEPCFLSSLYGMRDVEKARERFSEGRTRKEEDHYRFMDSMNDAIETYMFEETAPLPPKERKKEKAMERLEKLLNSQKKAKVERERESEGYRIMAESLYTNYQKIDGLLKEFDPEEYRRDPNSYPDVTSMERDRRGKGFIKVRMQTERGEDEVPLDLDRDINQNADLLYELSKKARSKMGGIDKAMNITREKMEKAEKEIASREENEEKKKDLRKFWFEKFRWCFSSESILMIGGKDARSNETVVKRYMRDEDLYAHADISGASSVVIRIDREKEMTDATREEGCHLSVLHSKAWNAKIGSAPAYWVISDQVSKTPQSGEFVSKGSFIIRGKKNMVSKLPLVGAVGTIYVEGVPKLMFGPERSVAENCSGTYFRVRPGRMKKSDAAKSISNELGGETEQLMSQLPSEEMDIEKVERGSD